MEETTPLLSNSNKSNHARIIEFNKQVAAYLFCWHIYPTFDRYRDRLSEIPVFKYDLDKIDKIIDFICRMYHFEKDKIVLNHDQITRKKTKKNEIYCDPDNLPKILIDKTMDNYFDQECMLKLFIVLLENQIGRAAIWKTPSGIYFIVDKKKDTIE